jgi:hypothetical protein
VKKPFLAVFKEGNAMNVPIRMLGIATSIFWIFLVAFIVSAAYSVKDLSFDMGEPQFAATPDGQLLFSLPLYIDNRGYYSLKGLNLSTVFSDVEGSEISRASTYVAVIPHGKNVTILHNVTLGMDSLFGSREQYLFHDSNFTAAVMAGLNFAELFPAQISTNFSYPWGAPFYNFALGQPSFGRFNVTHSVVRVPMSFENHAAFDLVGNIRVELYDGADAFLGETQTLFSVPQFSSYNGDVEFHVPLNMASLSASRNGHFEVYFSTALFEYGPLVIPYG